MKKLIISLSLILICSISFGQAIVQRSTAAFTPQDANLFTTNSFRLPVADDTTALNLITSLDSCGKMAYTRDVAAVWFRACTGYSSRIWIQIQPAGTASGQNPWIIGGNLGLFTSPVSPQYVGTKTNQGFGLLSNNIARLTITEDGAWGLGAGLSYGSSGEVLTSGGAGVAPTWAAASSSSTAWQLLGNSGTTAGTNFVGTIDSVDLVIKTKNLERFRVNARGALGLGTGTDYGTSGYLLKSNGSASAPAWVDPSLYLQTIYNSDGAVNSSRFVDATTAGVEDLYFGKLAEFGTMQWFANRFELNGSGSTRVLGTDSLMLAGNIIHLLDTSVSGSAANGYVWTLVDDTDGEGTWKAATGGSGITVGTTTITSGTNTRVLYNNSGVVGEYSITGTGNVAMSASPTFTGNPRFADGGTGSASITFSSNTNTGLATYSSGGGSADALLVTANNLGASMGVENTNASGFGGIEYRYGGATQVFTGLQNSSNEFRFNNIGSGGTIVFKINSVDKLKINNDGTVTMGDYGAGTATFDASGNISSVSDERLKTNIKPYNSGIKELMQLRPIQYSWNDKSGMETKGTYAGFSAQNVKDAIPLGTGVNADGYLSLQERSIIATLVNAVQEQQNQIDQLKKEIKQLKK